MRIAHGLELWVFNSKVSKSLKVAKSQEGFWLSNIFSVGFILHEFQEVLGTFKAQLKTVS